MQWCQSNFASKEDIKTRQNRGDFRQKTESRGVATVSCTLEKGIFGLTSEGQIIVQIRQIKDKKNCYHFFGKFWVFKANFQN
jgi:hypothetical protein